VLRLGLTTGALIAVAAVSFLAACGSDSSSSVCDRSAIADVVAAQAGVDAPARLDENGYGCADGWAYAYADVGTGEEEVTVTFVLKSSDGSWTVQDRATVCKSPGDEVPDAIFQEACESN
jgi:hypothetical protein